MNGIDDKVLALRAILAKLSEAEFIEVFGDTHQTRSFHRIYSAWSSEKLEEEVQREREWELERKKEREREREKERECVKEHELKMAQLRFEIMKLQHNNNKFSVLTCPSSLQPNDDRTKMRKECGVLCCNIAFVETQISLYATDETEEHISEYANLLMKHARRDQIDIHGPRRIEETVSELVLTSIFSAILQ